MSAVTHCADHEYDGEADERPFTTDAGGDGGADEGAEEGAALEDGDDVGGDLVRALDVCCAVGVKHVKLGLEVLLGDDAACDARVVPEEDDAPVGDEREPVDPDVLRERVGDHRERYCRVGRAGSRRRRVTAPAKFIASRSGA